MRDLLGRVPGPISTRPASAVTFSPTGEDYDFAIAGMGFHMAVRDELPYERQTAPFQKEQFDNAPVVGEQSLDGWWLRSQLSFHKGAGITYYDTLAGEEILDRFRDSEGVDPRTPGKVTLVSEASTYNTSHLSAMVDGAEARTEDFAGVTDTGTAVLLEGTTTTSVATSTAGTVVTGVANSGEDVYFSTETGIEVLPDTGTTLSSLWTSATPLHNLWWAKNRLFTVDESGDWWAVSTAGGALDATNRFWSSGQGPGVRSWSLADTPSAVMVAHRSTIYAISLDDQGNVPTITSGVVAAQLPNDEYVTDLSYSLGLLVVATSKGVRLAVVDGAQVVFGPLVVEGAAGASAVTGTTVHVGFTLSDGRDGVVALNLQHEVTDLVTAWHFQREVSSTVTPNVVAPASGGVYVLTDLGVVQTGVGANLAQQGYLMTGYQRFGTLEPKQFRSVKLRVGGDGGTVAIARVMSDGVEVPLYTIDVTGTFEEDITLGLSGPEEFIGLKFTLSRDDTDPSKGPVLLGYQLRAMPAPRRQRMLTVPLQCFDVERGSKGVDRGRAGLAWQRLRALEQAEQDGAIYTYQDFRTGEAGSAFVDEVRFINRTPPSDRSNGFGGYIVLRLRIVS